MNYSVLIVFLLFIFSAQATDLAPLGPLLDLPPHPGSRLEFYSFERNGKQEKIWLLRNAKGQIQARGNARLAFAQPTPEQATLLKRLTATIQAAFHEKVLLPRLRKKAASMTVNCKENKDFCERFKRTIEVCPASPYLFGLKQADVQVIHQCCHPQMLLGIDFGDVDLSPQELDRVMTRHEREVKGLTEELEKNLVSEDSVRVRNLRQVEKRMKAVATFLYPEKAHLIDKVEMHLVTRDVLSRNTGSPALSIPGKKLYFDETFFEKELDGTTPSTDILGMMMGHELGHAVLQHSEKTMDLHDRVAPGPFQSLKLNNAKWLMLYSQKQEIEADLFGINVARAAGYYTGQTASWYQSLDSVLDLEHPRGTFRSMYLMQDEMQYFPPVPIISDQAFPSPAMIQEPAPQNMEGP